MLPELEDLRCFLLAARSLNFRKASRAAALTPAAFGQRIKRLEERAGARLFQRTTRSVHLTEAGRRLAPVAERCLGEAAECVRAVRGDATPPPMELVVGSRHELGMSWVLPQFDALAERFPWLSLHLYVGSGSDLVLRVRTMEIDCAITSTRFTDPKLDAVRLHRESYVLCGERSLLARLPFRRPADAASHTLLDISSELPLFRYVRDAAAWGDGATFARIVRLGTIDAIRARVLAGAGVAVLPEYFVKEDLERGTLRRVLPSARPEHDFFRLVFRGDDPRRAVFEELARALREVPLV